MHTEWKAPQSCSRTHSVAGCLHFAAVARFDSRCALPSVFSFRQQEYKCILPVYTSAAPPPGLSVKSYGHVHISCLFTPCRCRSNPALHGVLLHLASCYHTSLWLQYSMLSYNLQCSCRKKKAMQGSAQCIKLESRPPKCQRG